jgi:hypothetical protein
VYVAGTGTFIMAGGTIRANKVLPGKDGGVNMGGTGTFIMTGGTISGNKALQDRGGRVFVGSGGIFSKGKAGGLSPGPAG